MQNCAKFSRSSESPDYMFGESLVKNQASLTQPNQFEHVWGKTHLCSKVTTMVLLKPLRYSLKYAYECTSVSLPSNSGNNLWNIYLCMLFVYLSAPKYHSQHQQKIERKRKEQNNNDNKNNNMNINERFMLKILYKDPFKQHKKEMTKVVPWLKHLCETIGDVIIGPMDDEFWMIGLAHCIYRFNGLQHLKQLEEKDPVVNWMLYNNNHCFISILHFPALDTQYFVSMDNIFPLVFTHNTFVLRTQRRYLLTEKISWNFSEFATIASFISNAIFHSCQCLNSERTLPPITRNHRSVVEYLWNENYKCVEDMPSIYEELNITKLNYNKRKMVNTEEKQQELNKEYSKNGKSEWFNKSFYKYEAEKIANQEKEQPLHQLLMDALSDQTGIDEIERCIFALNLRLASSTSDMKEMTYLVKDLIQQIELIDQCQSMARTQLVFHYPKLYLMLNEITTLWGTELYPLFCILQNKAPELMHNFQQIFDNQSHHKHATKEISSLNQSQNCSVTLVKPNILSTMEFKTKSFTLDESLNIVHDSEVKPLDTVKTDPSLNSTMTMPQHGFSAFEPYSEIKNVNIMPALSLPPIQENKILTQINHSPRSNMEENDEDSSSGDPDARLLRMSIQSKPESQQMQEDPDYVPDENELKDSEEEFEKEKDKAKAKAKAKKKTKTKTKSKDQYLRSSSSEPIENVKHQRINKNKAKGTKNKPSKKTFSKNKSFLDTSGEWKTFSTQNQQKGKGKGKRKENKATEIQIISSGSDSEQDKNKDNNKNNKNNKSDSENDENEESNNDSDMEKKEEYDRLKKAEEKLQDRTGSYPKPLQKQMKKYGLHIYPEVEYFKYLVGKKFPACYDLKEWKKAIRCPIAGMSSGLILRAGPLFKGEHRMLEIDGVVRPIPPEEFVEFVDKIDDEELCSAEVMQAKRWIQAWAPSNSWKESQHNYALSALYTFQTGLPFWTFVKINSKFKTGIKSTQDDICDCLAELILDKTERTTEGPKKKWSLFYPRSMYEKYKGNMNALYKACLPYIETRCFYNRNLRMTHTLCGPCVRPIILTLDYNTTVEQCLLISTNTIQQIDAIKHAFGPPFRGTANKNFQNQRGSIPQNPNLWKALNDSHDYAMYGLFFFFF